MIPTRFSTTALSIATSLALICLGSSASAAVLALTGGDAGEGLNLTGQTVLYSVNTNSSANQTIQGAVFTGTFAAQYGTAVQLLKADGSWNQTMNAFSAPTANDTNMTALLNDYQFGEQVWQFNTVATTSYQLTLLGGLASDGAGSATGYIGNFGFRQAAGTTDFNDYTLVNAGVVTPTPTNPGSGYALTYDFVAAGSVASFIITYNGRLATVPTGGRNDGGAIGLGGWSLTTVVPEPSTMGLLALAGTGLAMLRRRRTAASA